MQRTWKAATLALTTLALTMGTVVPTGAWPSRSTGTASADATTERPAPAPFATWGDLVDRQYGDILDRAPTAAERTTATTALEGSSQAPGQFVADLLTRPEHASVVDPAVRLYQAFFLRPPDASGFDFWVRRRRAGTWTLVRMADQFARSSEFQGRYGSLGDGAYVDLVYQHVLGRPADPGGRSFWIGRLQRRATTRGHLMASFSESTEHRATTAARTTTTVVFLHLLGRPPTAGEQASLIEAGPATTEPAKLAGEVLRDHEYLRHVEPTSTAPTLVSVGPDGVTPAGSSSVTDATADGRYLLVSADPAALGFGDGIYLWERFVGLRAVPTRPLDVAGARAYPGAISDDGTTIAYTVPTAGGPTWSEHHLFLYDRKAGTTEQVDTGEGHRTGPTLRSGSMPADGSAVVYETVPIDGARQVWHWDRTTKQTTLVSRTPSGNPVPSDTAHATISADGTTVTFISTHDLRVEEPPADGPGAFDPWAWDRATDTLVPVTTAPASTPFDEGTGSLWCWISRTAGSAGFVSRQPFDPTDGNADIDLYVLDRYTGEHRRVTTDAPGPGRTTALALGLTDSHDTAIVQRSIEGPAGDVGDIVLWDRATDARRTIYPAFPTLDEYLHLDDDAGSFAFFTGQPLVPGDLPDGSDYRLGADVFVLPIPPA